MEQARRLEPWRQQAGAVLFVLPDAAWARRASGTLANDLAKAHAASAVAIVSPKTAGGYLVSVRVPRDSTVLGGGVLPPLSDGRRAADSRGCEPSYRAKSWTRSRPRSRPSSARACVMTNDQ